jgi:hypothetical protein
MIRIQSGESKKEKLSFNILLGLKYLVVYLQNLCRMF